MHTVNAALGCLLTGFPRCWKEAES